MRCVWSLVSCLGLIIALHVGAFAQATGNGQSATTGNVRYAIF